MARPKKYFTEEERKAASIVYKRKYREAHKGNNAAACKKWEEEHPIELRANQLLQAYNKEDSKRGRGEGDLTAKWIVENIFSKPCVHCGKTGWEVIGCNRIDNSKPHTMDNVEPCCKECNTDMWVNEVSKEVHQYTLDGELVRIWKSSAECGRNGFCQQQVASCCRGERKIHKGFKWAYE